MKRTCWLWVGCVWLVGFSCMFAQARGATPEEEQHIAEMYRQMRNPRATVAYFLEKVAQKDFDDALLAMDFTGLSHLSDSEKQFRANTFYEIFIRLENFRLSTIPEKCTTQKCKLKLSENDIVIVLQCKPDETWLFDSETVGHIDEYYDKIQNKAPTFTKRTWFRYLPNFMYFHVCGMMIVQWSIFLISIVVSIFVKKNILKLFAFFLQLFFKFARGHKEYAPFIQRALRPVAYLAMVYMWYWSLIFAMVSPLILNYIAMVIHPLGLLLVMVSLLRSADVFAIWFRRKVKVTGNKVGHILVDFIVTILKFIIICLGVMIIVQIFGFSAIGILSGMGIGGIAVALAAQQTISNFFGSLAILMDKPFTVGDHVIINTVEGTVESVGVRSTRIRTFYDSCVYIPNSSLADTTIDNMGKRLYRRFKTCLRLRYGTPSEKLAEFTQAIYEILKNCPEVVEGRSDVAVYDFSDYSINVQLICFLQVASLQEENAHREIIILQILELAEKMGISFAEPVWMNASDRKTV